MAVDAAAMTESPATALRMWEQVLAVLVADEPLNIVIQNLDSCDEPGAAFTAVCRQLRDAARAAAAYPTSIGICLDAGALPARAAWRTRHRFLGHGPLYLMIRQTRGPAWLNLWRERNNPMLRPVYASTVTSRCRLLAAEDALAVVPRLEIQAPTGSAWVAVRLDVANFEDEYTIVEALRAAVDAGDARHRSARWPTAQMRHDAWLNRRLAIEIVGIGDLLVRLGIDPTRAKTLRQAHGWLAQAADVVHARSRQIAGRHGRIPALEHSPPDHFLPKGAVRDDWMRRWQNAVEVHGLRHRNLLVMQPWSLLPRSRPAQSRYGNLLPLLRHADACSFPCPPSVAHWSANEFRHFHQRALSALHQRDAAHQIAEPL